MLKTLAEPRVDGGQDAGGQVQLLLLDDGGVHLKLDSAGKRVDEGEKRRVVARGTPAWPEQKEESLTLSLKKIFLKNYKFTCDEEKWTTAGRS